MLIAHLGTERVAASTAQRGAHYQCPNCSGIMILRKGRIVKAHFSHKPPFDCSLGKGETVAHMNAKLVIENALLKRELEVKLEFVVNTPRGDRRADVMTWSPHTERGIVFELQHTEISLDEIEDRAWSYASAGIAQIWIPFLQDTVLERAERSADGLVVENYSSKPFERWIHGLSFKHGGMWMYHAKNCEFWFINMQKIERYIEHGTRYEDGSEISYGGYNKYFKKLRKLILKGPYKFEQLRIITRERQEKISEKYKWPSGWVANLELK